MLTDVMLEHFPNETTLMVHKGHAYFLLGRRLIDQYKNLRNFPPEALAQWIDIGQANKYWFDKAESLGWRRPSKEDEAKYVDIVKRAEAAQR